VSVHLQRAALSAVVLVAGLIWCSSGALASVDISAGIRHLSPDGTLTDCSAKAKESLDAFLVGAAESTPGSGDWIAYSPNGITGTPTATAVVRCYPLPNGYFVTFTCVVQLPDNPYTANALCLDVAHKFYGGALTALAPIPTPTPVPTGCATTNLVGSWVSDDDPKLTFTMDLNGNVMDNQGVSGNWGLKGNTVTFTYYGNHTMTLSSDGRHLRGGGYSLTRKC
jgi:hypothetical protein